MTRNELDKIIQYLKKLQNTDKMCESNCIHPLVNKMVQPRIIMQNTLHCIWYLNKELINSALQNFTKACR
jgi:hypothetical protein